MNDLTAIILTYNEELHIARCLERILPFVREVYVVDCFSTDRTARICAGYGNVRVVPHEWPGNQALQFNWALDHIEVKTGWIIRLDADEYLLPGEGERLLAALDARREGETALSLSRARYFLGRRIRHGGTDMIPLVRVFRTGKGRSEVRAMDEHIVVTEGHAVETDVRFADDNLHSLAWWTQKHLRYAEREAAMLLEAENRGSAEGGSEAMRAKRRQKMWYARLPLFWRAFAYFAYRYFLRLGFLDGREGFLWHFLQGWWYRVMVDSLVCGAGREQPRPARGRGDE